MSGEAASILEQFNTAFIEFLNPNTPTARRSEIDNAFTDFQRQANSWRLCLEMMPLTNNPHIHLIIQNTFIYVLKHKWSGLSGEEKNLIRETEISFYMAHFASYPISIMELTAKTIAWISTVESELYLQQMLDFIAAGLQDVGNAQSQLILLEVLLEEIYESGGCIPLLTERKKSIVGIIQNSLSGILSTIEFIIQSPRIINEQIVKTAIAILQLIITNNNVADVINPALLEGLFRLVYDASSDFSVNCMQCITELLMKRLIPPNYSGIYLSMVNTITSIIKLTAESIESMTTDYCKSLNLLVYHFIVNYLSVVLTNPQFDFSSFVSSLYEYMQGIKARVKYTSVQQDPRLYLQVIAIWSELLNLFVQNSIRNDAIIPHMVLLVQFCTSVLLHCNHHILLESSDTKEEFIDDNEILYEADIESVSRIDDMTGDFAEVPLVIYPAYSEYDFVVKRSLEVISRIMAIKEIFNECGYDVYKMCMLNVEATLDKLKNGSLKNNEDIEDSCVIMQLISYINFQDNMLHVLTVLHQLIMECYTASIYMYGQGVTRYYVFALMTYKQCIFTLNNQLAPSDLALIISSLYETLTNSITVPPNLLLITISNVLIYLASNCRLDSLCGLSFVTPLIQNFLKETSQCPLIIQSQIFFFLIHLLQANLSSQEYQRALSSLLLPIINSITSPVSSSYHSYSSIYVRSAYLLSSVLKQINTTSKETRDILLSQIMPIFENISSTLFNICTTNDNGFNYENSRILWNFVLYASAIIRGRKTYEDWFLKDIGKLLGLLTSCISQIRNTAKTMIYELHSMKLLYLIKQVVCERKLPYSFLSSTILLLSSIGNITMNMMNVDITILFVECCSMIFEVHSLSVLSNNDIMEYILVLSQFLLLPLSSSTAPQDLISLVLKIYKNTGMLTFYKTDCFKSGLRGEMSLVILQHVLSNLHSNLNDELLITLYTINSCNFQPFYTTDLAAFLASTHGLNNEAKDAILKSVELVNDMPSFLLQMTRLMKDIRIYITNE